MSFSTTIDKLISRINLLEEKFDSLSSNEKLQNNSGVIVYSKKYLNFQILKQRTLNIIDLQNTTKSQLFFQLKIKFYINSPQDIQFKMFADKILLTQNTSNYQSGYNEVILFSNYQNLISDLIKIQLQIKTKDDKQILVSESILTVWGMSEKETEEYESLICGGEIFLSYIENKRLYYKLFNNKSDPELYDFNYLDDAISHSICTNGDNIILFKVDLSGNLFYRLKLTDSEYFISGNVSNVSCCFFNDKITYVYISAGQVFYGEIYNNTVISNNKLINPHGTFEKCHLKYNPHNNKCYLLLTKADKSNYLLETINNSLSSSENICAEIKLNINIT